MGSGPSLGSAPNHKFWEENWFYNIEKMPHKKKGRPHTCSPSFISWRWCGEWFGSCRAAILGWEFNGRRKEEAHLSQHAQQLKHSNVGTKWLPNPCTCLTQGMLECWTKTWHDAKTGSRSRTCHSDTTQMVPGKGQRMPFGLCSQQWRTFWNCFTIGGDVGRCLSSLE